jgi:uncharacterized integral membrane protein
MMRVFAFILIGLTIIGAALFSVQNAASVSIQFLAWRSLELPLGLVLSVCFTLGLLLAVLVPFIWRFAAVYEDLDEVSFADRSTFKTGTSDEDWD